MSSMPIFINDENESGIHNVQSQGTAVEVCTLVADKRETLPAGTAI